MRNNRIEKACIRINVPTPTGFLNQSCAATPSKSFFSIGQLRWCDRIAAMAASRPTADKSMRMPFARMLPRVLGWIGSLKRRAAIPSNYDPFPCSDNSLAPRLAIAAPRRTGSPPVRAPPGVPSPAK
jgi:hypothetical protein